MRPLSSMAGFILAACTLLPGGARAANWVADPAASRLGFSGVQLGQPFQGTFKTFTARIVFDPAQPQAGSADVTVDLSTAVTGDAQRDTALPQPEWFDVKTAAAASFHAAGFVAKGGDKYEAPGKLTIRGVGVDVTLPFTLKIDGDTAHATGHVELLRSTFGIGQGPWANEDYVAFKVDVDVDLVAHKAD